LGLSPGRRCFWLDTSNEDRRHRQLSRLVHSGLHAYGIGNVGNLALTLADPLLEAVPGALAGSVIAAVLRPMSLSRAGQRRKAILGTRRRFAWTVSFVNVSQLIDRDSAWGYHAGGSVTYLVVKHVGVGMTVRYSEASHTTTNHCSDTSFLAPSGIWGSDTGTTNFTMKHGGIQWNGGVSLHF
jgi:hypothetical protein